MQDLPLSFTQRPPLFDAGIARFGRIDSAAALLRRGRHGPILELDRRGPHDGGPRLPRSTVPFLEGHRGGDEGQRRRPRTVPPITSASAARPTPPARRCTPSARAAGTMLARNVAVEMARFGLQVNAVGTNFMDFPEFLRSPSGGDDPAVPREARSPRSRSGDSAPWTSSPISACPSSTEPAGSRRASSWRTPADGRDPPGFQLIDDSANRPGCGDPCRCVTVSGATQGPDMAHDRSAWTSRERERASVFHSWSAESTLNPFMVKDAQGVYVTGEAGVTYLDFSSQLVNTNLGHQHPSVVKAIQDQAAVLARSPRSTATVALPGRRAHPRSLLQWGREGLFTNGGTEAVEPPRMARLHTGRHKVHGDAIAATTARRDVDEPHRRSPALAQRQRDPRAWSTSSGRSSTERRSTPTTEAQECARALESLETTILFEGPSAIAAIILETVPGTAGIMVPPEGFPAGRSRHLRPLRHCLHRRRGHVPASVERARGSPSSSTTSRPTWSRSPRAWTPATCPWAASCSTRRSSATFNDRVYPGGSPTPATPSPAPPRSPRSRRWRSEGMIENAGRIGDEVLRPGLEALAEQHPIIGEVRGLRASSSPSTS